MDANPRILQKGTKASTFENVTPFDINCGSISPKLGEFDCLYVVRITLIPHQLGGPHFFVKFGRN